MIRARAYVHCYRGFNLFASDLRDIASWRKWYSRWVSPLFFCDIWRASKSCTFCPKELCEFISREELWLSWCLFTDCLWQLVQSPYQMSKIGLLYAWTVGIYHIPHVLEWHLIPQYVSSVGSSRISTMALSLHKRQPDVEDTSALLMHSRSTDMQLGGNRRAGLEWLDSCVQWSSSETDQGLHWARFSCSPVSFPMMHRRSREHKESC
jgi:hypothetical protein